MRTKEFTEQGRRFLAVETDSPQITVSLKKGDWYIPLFQLSRATEEDFAKVVEQDHHYFTPDGSEAIVYADYSPPTRISGWLGTAKKSFITLLKWHGISDYADLVLFEIKNG